MTINTLEEKFTFELNSIYDAEHQFLEAQQTMLESANSSDVKAMLEKHIAETEQQIVNLTRVHEILGLTAKRQTCAAAKGLVTEGNTILTATADVPALADLAINGSNFKVEHFEIATYRGLIAGAQMMGQTEVVQLLSENLQQEENTAQALEASKPALLEKAMTTASKSAGM
jgi:ferritin-like metal-binding protein YciE